MILVKILVVYLKSTCLGDALVLNYYMYSAGVELCRLEG